MDKFETANNHHLVNVLHTTLPDVQDETKEIVISRNNTGDDIEDDYEFVREGLYDLINRITKTTDRLEMVARETESARFFEVLNSSYKNLADLYKDALEIHDKKKRLKEQSSKPTQDKNGVYVDKAIFTGTTADLQKHVKKNDTN